MEQQVSLKNNDRPVVLIGATMWWPLSARLAMALIRHGCRVSAVCPPRHPLRFVRGIEGLYPYKGPALRRAITASRPDIVVPCDDGVVWQLHSLHGIHPDVRLLIERSLGPPEMYPTIRSRGRVLQAAAELGIRVPPTETLNSEQQLGGWCAETAAVLKLDGTWGGTGVEIAHSPGEALAAFRRMAKPQGASVAWKRSLVNRDPFALWAWRNREEPRVTIQQFIPGRPANTMFACWQGEVLSIVTVEVVSAQGTTGAATVVRLIHNAEIAEAARLIARRFRLNGFHGLDFVLESGTGAAYLIELNPRSTQLGHLRLPGQGDLAGVFSAKLKGEDPPLEGDPITSDTVAFFPQAFSWNPQSPYLHRGYHDVPWEEPGLLRELLREPWPDRQWLARLYHFFRPPKRLAEVQFDEAAQALRSSQ
jgi:ATP-grasp domain